MCCPICAAGDVAEQSGLGFVVGCCGTCLFGVFAVMGLRNNYRTKFHVEGNVVEDILLGWCCPTVRIATKINHA